MDMYDSNLQALFKEHRKCKKMFPPHWIKLIGFQLFKGLYYLKVCFYSFRIIMYAIAT